MSERDTSQEAVLAAVERAVRHRIGERPVPLWTILEHLAIARRSPAARGVRSALVRLQERGWLQGSIEHGVAVWRPTAAGRSHAARASVLLPESPQHLAWRDARRAAGAEIERFRARLAASLEQAAAMLAASQPQLGEGPSSDEWLLLSLRLAGDCRRLGSAWHCLLEWREPSELTADIDAAASEGEPDPRLRAMRAGRRNVRLWREAD